MFELYCRKDKTRKELLQLAKSNKKIVLADIPITGNDWKMQNSDESCFACRQAPEGLNFWIIRNYLNRNDLNRGICNGCQIYRQSLKDGTYDGYGLHFLRDKHFHRTIKNLENSELVLYNWSQPYRCDICLESNMQKKQNCIYKCSIFDCECDYNLCLDCHSLVYNCYSMLSSSSILLPHVLSNEIIQYTYKTPHNLKTWNMILRPSILSKNELLKRFPNIFDEIPDIVVEVEEDAKKWLISKLSKDNNAYQIYSEENWPSGYQIVLKYTSENKGISKGSFKYIILFVLIFLAFLELIF